MDLVLHAERLAGKAKRRHQLALADLPDERASWLPISKRACCVAAGCYAGRQKVMLRRGRVPRDIKADVLTPPSILAILAAGYEPLWHPSADAPACAPQN